MSAYNDIVYHTEKKAFYMHEGGKWKLLVPVENPELLASSIKTYMSDVIPIEHERDCVYAFLEQLKGK